MFAQPSAVKSVTDELVRQSNTIAVGSFNTEVKTLQLCSFALAKGVAHEIKTRVLDIVPFKNLEHTKLTKSAANSAVEYDEKRRFLSLAKTYGRPAPKAGDEKLLETAMKDLLASCVHMKYLLQTLDLRPADQPKLKADKHLSVFEHKSRSADVSQGQNSQFRP